MGLVREAEWAGRVAKWRASGLSADRFAATRGFSGSALRYWASRLAKPASTATTTAPPSAPAPAKIKIARVVARRSSPTAGITLEVSGTRIAVAPGFDRATLRAVLEILGAVSPARTR
jgi:hypothetical protein